MNSRDLAACSPADRDRRDRPERRLQRVAEVRAGSDEPLEDRVHLRLDVARWSAAGQRQHPVAVHHPDRPARVRGIVDPGRDQLARGGRDEQRVGRRGEREQERARPRSRRTAPGTATGRAGPSTTVDRRRSVCRGSGSACARHRPPVRVRREVRPTEDDRASCRSARRVPAAPSVGRPGPTPTVPVRILGGRERPIPACAPGAGPWTAPRSGSCARPDGTCPSTASSAADRDILETIREPEVAVELTLQPLRRMPLDAAIVFADIMVPVAAIGVPVRIEAGSGPVLDDPIRDAAGVGRLRTLEPDVDEPHVARDDPPPPQGAQGPADRVRRRAVHARELPRRGRLVARSRPDEGADARRPPPRGRR